jgi:predicted transport protein
MPMSEGGFTRDVTNIGHQGTGNLEIRIENASDVKRLSDSIKDRICMTKT